MGHGPTKKNKTTTTRQYFVAYIDSRYQSEKNSEENEKNVDKLGIDLGLLIDQKQGNKIETMEGNGTQFIHRTLVARYIP